MLPRSAGDEIVIDLLGTAEGAGDPGPVTKSGPVCEGVGVKLKLGVYPRSQSQAHLPRLRLLQQHQYTALLQMLLTEVKAAAEVFWLRRSVRREVLKRLALDCAAHGPRLRRKAAELRAAAARSRLERLRGGDGKSLEDRSAQLREALEAASRTMAELAPRHEEPDGGGGGHSHSQVEEQPGLLRGGQLMPHQLQGLRWLVALTDTGMSGILADDMGLGKTVQALAFLAFLAERRAERGPHLILVPFSLLSHWVEEFTSWLPSFSYVVFRGTKSQTQALRQELVRNMNRINVVLTTFESVISHHAFLCSFPWFCVVADEGHRLKNANTQITRLCHNLPCRHRLLLTGTPVQNSLSELWSLLSFIAPQAFCSLDEFHSWFALPPPPAVKLRSGGGTSGTSTGQGAGAAAGAGAGTSSGVLSEEEELLIIQRLHSVLRPFLLRRTKDLVLADLPEKREVVLWVPVSAWQQALYNNALSRLRQESSGGGLGSPSSVMELRKAVNHPYHFSSGRREDHLVRASGKFELLDRVLPRLLHFGHKVLIFAQMTSSLDLLQRLLQQKGIKYGRIDGNMGLRRRREAIHLFRTEADVEVLLLTTRAGGLGLNLQVADTVILFDSDWNPQVDAQAMDRAHRIGQQRQVLVVRLLTPTTLDIGMLARLGGKLDMERKVISAGRFDHDHDPADTDMQGHAGALLRELLHEARQSSLAAAPSTSDATPLRQVSRLLARSEEERLALEAADEELLGPDAADDTGASEGVLARLTRCGRLLGPTELELELGLGLEPTAIEASPCADTSAASAPGPAPSVSASTSASSSSGTVLPSAFASSTASTSTSTSTLAPPNRRRRPRERPLSAATAERVPVKRQR